MAERSGQNVRTIPSRPRVEPSITWGSGFDPKRSQLFRMLKTTSSEKMIALQLHHGAGRRRCACDQLLRLDRHVFLRSHSTERRKPMNQTLGRGTLLAAYF